MDNELVSHQDEVCNKEVEVQVMDKIDLNSACVIADMENFESKREGLFPHTSEDLAPEIFVLSNVAKEGVVACMFKEILCKDICFEVIDEKETLYPDDRQRESTCLVYLCDDMEMDDASSPGNVVAVDSRRNILILFLPYQGRKCLRK